MTTAREREAILTEYGQWVEQKTLDGLDLSVEAYLDEVETKEKAERSDRIHKMLTGEGSNDSGTFLERLARIYDIEPKEGVKANELKRG